MTTVLVVLALVCAGAVLAVRLQARSRPSPRDQVAAFSRARQMTNQWSADPGSTPEPLRRYLSQQRVGTTHEPPDPG